MSEQKNTGADGTAVFDLEPGVYKYTASKSGYKTADGSFEVTTGNIAVPTIILQVSYAATFNVTIFDGGADLEGAVVTVAQVGHPFLQQTTGASGQVVFDLLPGSYLWSIYHPEYSTEQGTFDVVSSAVIVNQAMTTVALEQLWTPPGAGEIVSNPAGVPKEAHDQNPYYRALLFRSLDKDIYLRKVGIYAYFTDNYVVRIWRNVYDNSSYRTYPYQDVRGPMPGNAGAWSWMDISSAMKVDKYNTCAILVSTTPMGKQGNEYITTPNQMNVNSTEGIQYINNLYCRDLSIPRLMIGTNLGPSIVEATSWMPLINAEFSDS